MPRRTNLGASFLHSASPNFHVDWVPSANFAAFGGGIMTVGMIIYFLIFFGTLLGKMEEEPALDFPISEPYHDENYAVVRDFKPWVVAAVLAVIIAYAAPLYQAVTISAKGSPAYMPDNPSPRRGP